jgi:hypothetical protein
VEFDDLSAEHPEPTDPEERKEVVIDRRNILKRAGLGAAALAVPSSVLATPAFGAVTSSCSSTT